MSTYSLSVLLPCRDAAEHLPQAIRSLQSQTYSDFQVVAVDDGSTDDTPILLERWAAVDDRVQVLHRESAGLPEALRAGVALCSGDLIARFDADDVAHPRRFAEQIALLSDQPDLAASGTHVRYFPRESVGWGARRYERWLNGLVQAESLARDIYVECPLAHPSAMFRRSALEEIGGYRSNGWPEDYDLILRLHGAGARLANVPKVLHFWREREDRISRTDSRYSPRAFRECKVHHLLDAQLRGRHSVALWGAGRVGKAFAQALAGAGVRVGSFYDIDPAKIGQSVYETPVRHVAGALRPSGEYLLVAVGAAGARELIRSQLDAAGLREPEDYRCVA